MTTRQKRSKYNTYRQPPWQPNRTQISPMQTFIQEDKYHMSDTIINRVSHDLIFYSPDYKLQRFYHHLVHSGFAFSSWEDHFRRNTGVQKYDLWRFLFILLHLTIVSLYFWIHLWHLQAFLEYLSSGRCFVKILEYILILTWTPSFALLINERVIHSI